MDAATAHVADELFEPGKLFSLAGFVVYEFVVGHMALDDGDFQIVLGCSFALLNEIIWIGAWVGGDDVGDANLGGEGQMMI